MTPEQRSGRDQVFVTDLAETLGIHGYSTHRAVLSVESAPGVRVTFVCQQGVWRRSEVIS